MSRMSLAVTLALTLLPGAASAMEVRTNLPIADFAGWADDEGAAAVVGDFDGDGADDLALAGGVHWRTIPVALSNRDGTFEVSNSSGEGNEGFAIAARESRMELLAGDFDGDGHSDLALIPRDGCEMHMAFAREGGDGAEVLFDHEVADLSTVLCQSEDGGLFGLFGTLVDVFDSDLVAVSGDFVRGGGDEIALSTDDWSTVTVARVVSVGGSLEVLYQGSLFDHDMGEGPSEPVVGTFSGYQDQIALVGVDGILVASLIEDITVVPPPECEAEGVDWLECRTSNPFQDVVSDGYRFELSQTPAPSFGAWSAQSDEVQVLAGAFGRGDADAIVLAGNPGWTTVPSAESDGEEEGPAFEVRNTRATQFAAWAAVPGAILLGGNFDGVGDKEELALIGPAGWRTVPILWNTWDVAYPAGVVEDVVVRWHDDIDYVYNGPTETLQVGEGLFSKAGANDGVPNEPLPFSNDKIEGIYVPRGVSAYLTRDDSFGGQSILFHGDDQDHELVDGLYEEVSSLHVYATGGPFGCRTECWLLR